MSAWWNHEFLPAFCEVQAVCTSGDPNWLGWIAIAGFCFIVFSIISAIIARP